MIIKVFVSNLAKYNDGELTGQWTTLPVDDVNKDILDKLELGGNSHDGYNHDWFISDYEAPFKINEYDDLYDLNELAEALESYDTIEDIYNAIDDKEAIYLPELFDDLVELIEVLGVDPVEAARATFFGKIQNWNDDYFYINEVGNFESMNEYQFQKMLEDNANAIVDEFKKENL
ncbi:antirestriction protein ArdA [Limosilactobacillus reuteri]|uniref:antirestriction protein ArdA n=1 Tax=Limosilactobacillus reuteri TaxID=1598 RepID=UPI001957AA07|nr:antirestriction protein ArdA [Limosilactobacillus reuteri]MBM6812228.1 antirestriction protein ArdA [Limosilactobacillus reuteri]